MRCKNCGQPIGWSASDEWTHIATPIRGLRCVLNDGKTVAEPIVDDQAPMDFPQELQTLLNKHGVDAKVGMPDFILSSFLVNIIVDLQHANAAHERWKQG